MLQFEREEPKPPAIMAVVWRLTTEQAEHLYYYLRNAAHEYEHHGQPGSLVSEGAWLVQRYVEEVREKLHLKGYREWMANMGQTNAVQEPSP